MNETRSADRIKNILFYMGVSREDYTKVRPLIEEENRRLAQVWSVCIACFWIMSLLLSLRSEAFLACRSVYAWALVVSAVTLAAARFLVKRFPGMLFPVSVLFLISVLGAGIGIAYFQPDVRTITMFVFAVIVPTFFIHCALLQVIMQVLTIIVYVILTNGVIEPTIYFWGWTNLIIFSVAGVMVGYVFNKSRTERFVYAESARELADIQTRYAYYDQLTGLKNRRAYVEEIDNLKNTRPDHFCLIMADLNGLKRNNDMLGHEAGDEMLVAAAKCMTEAFGGTDSVYRIGGDEFCIIQRGTVEEAEKCLARMEELGAAWKGQLVSGISISYGLAASDDGADLDTIIKLADQKMYEHKRNYYMNSGFDRRRR